MHDTNPNICTPSTLIRALYNMVVNMGIVLTIESRCGCHAFYYFICEYACVWCLVKGFSTKTRNRSECLWCDDQHSWRRRKSEKNVSNTLHPFKLSIHAFSVCVCVECCLKLNAKLLFGNSYTKGEIIIIVKALAPYEQEHNASMTPIECSLSVRWALYFYSNR